MPNLCCPCPLLPTAIYGPVYRVRDFMALLQQLSLLPTPQLAMQAAAALTSNYLTMNTYEFEETRCAGNSWLLQPPHCGNLAQRPNGKGVPIACTASNRAFRGSTHPRHMLCAFVAPCHWALLHLVTGLCCTMSLGFVAPCHWALLHHVTGLCCTMSLGFVAPCHWALLHHVTGLAAPTQGCCCARRAAHVLPCRCVLSFWDLFCVLGRVVLMM